MHETLYVRNDDFAEKVWEIAPNSLWKRYYQLWKGIVSAREKADAGSRLIQGQLVGCAKAQSYLWAIRFKQGSSEAPSLAGDMTESVYRQCQDVLLQVGAWEALPRLKECFPTEADYTLLPVHRYYAYLGAPVEAIESLLRTAGQCKDNLASRDESALGSLAIHAGMLQQASDWFYHSCLCEPSSLEAAVGFSLVSRLIARRQLPAHLSGTILEEIEETRIDRTIRGFMIMQG